MATTKIHISLFPSQQKFVMSKKKQTIFVSGRGVGKSLVTLITAINEAKKPNNEVLLVRKTYDELRTKLLPQLFEHPIQHPLNTIPMPLLQEGVNCTWNQSDRSIRLNNGGIIRYCSMDDKLKIRGFTVGSVFIDELVEFTELEYLELLQILRSPYGNRQIYACTNPSNQSSWIFKRFVKNRNDDTTEYISASSTENTTLAQDYLQGIRDTHTEEQCLQMIEGQWLSNEGCIYKEFNREVHIKKQELNHYKDFYIGMDYGFTDPNAFLLAGKNGSQIHIFEERCKSGMLHDDIIEYLESLNVYNAPVICDPSAAGIIALIESKGITCYKAKNEREAGINSVKNLLNKNKLTIDPSCKNLIESIESYKMDDKGKPEHKMSHMVDSLRYLSMHLSCNVDNSNYVLDLDNY
jgi:PBSX family phage terminase large subunit